MKALTNIPENLQRSAIIVIMILLCSVVSLNAQVLSNSFINKNMVYFSPKMMASTEFEYEESHEMEDWMRDFATWQVNMNILIEGEDFFIEDVIEEPMMIEDWMYAIDPAETDHYSEATEDEEMELEAWMLDMEVWKRCSGL